MKAPDPGIRRAGCSHSSQNANQGAGTKGRNDLDHHSLIGSTDRFKDFLFERLIEALGFYRTGNKGEDWESA